jgi:predicted DNA-binding WGR domain protein
MSGKRMFELVAGSSSKFWEVWRDGNEVRTRYGRIGSDGSTTVKSEADEARAQKLYDKLVKEKTGKGYIEKTAGGAAAAPAPAAAAPAPVGKRAVKPAPQKAVESDDGEGAGGGDGGDGGFARYQVDEKFWAIRLDGARHTVKYGKIGTNGAEKTKTFASPAEAKKDHDKLVKEKTGKGYQQVDGDDDEAAAPAATKPAQPPAPAPTPAANDDDDEADDGGDGGDEAGGSWRRFEVDEKFWAISIDGASHTVKYGKIGTDGQEKTKTFDDEDAAQRDYDQLVKEKTGKGYAEVG